MPYMEGEPNNHLAEQQIVGTAIRAAERQLNAVHESRGAETLSKEQRFFALLDGLVGEIFSGVTEQIKRNERIFYLNSIPDFRARCDEIFGRGFGDFPSELFNRWLYSRDLRHIWFCVSNTLVW